MNEKEITFQYVADRISENLHQSAVEYGVSVCNQPEVVHYFAIFILILAGMVIMQFLRFSDLCHRYEMKLRQEMRRRDEEREQEVKR